MTNISDNGSYYLLVLLYWITQTYLTIVLTGY